MSSSSKGLRLAGRIAVTQIVIGLLCALISYGLDGSQSAKAALFGAFIAVTPGLYFALRVFSARPGSAPQKMLSALYTGEVGKMLLTGALFVLAALWFPAHLLPVISTYGACLVANWLAMARQG